MRLLLVNYEFPPVGGGASNATWFIGRELARSGHHVCVLTSAFGKLRGFAEEEGVRVYRVRSLRKARDRSNILEMGSFALCATLAANKIAISENIEGCILFFTLPSGPIGLALKWRLGIPYLVSLRGGDVPGHVTELNLIHRMLAPLRRVILNDAASIVANSPGLAELSMLTDPFPVQIVPNGVDADYFTPQVGQPKDGNTFRLLFVGRLQKEKNLQLVLDSVRVLTTRTTRQVVLDIVGDGPLREDMLRYASNIGVQEHLLWDGWVSKERLRDFYRAADCFVNPSLYEGMPNTVLEAMACGLPVVASDIGGNQDLVVHGRTGFLFTLGNNGDFFEAIRMLIENAEQALMMGASGRARVVNEFSWIQVARRYVQLLQNTSQEMVHTV